MYETAREEFILKWLKLLKKLNRKLQKEIFFFLFLFSSSIIMPYANIYFN